MASSVLSRVRLFPLLIGVAIIALGVRGVDIYVGYDMLNQSAIASEQDAKTDGQTAAEENHAAADTQEETQPADNQPIMIGLPSSEEMELITQLRERRVELEKRAQQLDLQEQLLAGTEKRINDKIDQLKQLEERIKGHLKLFEAREEERLASIVKVYETMNPKDAAPRFEALGLETQLELVTRMKPSKVADLMEKMTPRAASVLTTELATLAQPPRIEELQGNK